MVTEGTQAGVSPALMRRFTSCLPSQKLDRHGKLALPAGLMWVELQWTGNKLTVFGMTPETSPWGGGVRRNPRDDISHGAVWGNQVASSTEARLSDRENWFPSWILCSTFLGGAKTWREHEQRFFQKFRKSVEKKQNKAAEKYLFLVHMEASQSSRWQQTSVLCLIFISSM